eukprot:4367755-Prymnesium_polylepis.1
MALSLAGNGVRCGPPNREVRLRAGSGESRAKRACAARRGRPAVSALPHLKTTHSQRHLF